MSDLRVAVLVFATALTCCARRAPAPPDAPDAPDVTVGVHGMLLFGEERAYLSHLPLYRAPHDRQLILAARLLASDSTPGVGAAGPHAIYVADRRASGERVYTVEPERHSLHAIASVAPGAPVRFRATVYRGHFERGGTPLLRDVVVEVERAVVARALKAADVDSGGRYVLFGAPNELYVAHRVAGAPSYDQVARVALDGGPNALPAAEALGGGVAVAVEARDGRAAGELAPRDRPLRDGERVTFRVGGSRARLTLAVTRVLYVEFDDLASAPRP